MNTFAQLAHRAITSAEVMCLAQAKHHAHVLDSTVDNARGINLTGLLEVVDRSSTLLREALIAANQLRECLIQLPDELTEEVMPIATILALNDATGALDWEKTKPAIVLVLTRAKPPHIQVDETPADPPKTPEDDDFDVAAGKADETEPLPPPRAAAPK